MTGEMRDFIFGDIGNHAFFNEINIPYRRYARQQVAAQIALNYASNKRNGEFHRSRYLDLQEFFKDKNKLGEDDKELFEGIRERLDKTREHFGDKLGIIGNRAVAVSVFLFVGELIDRSKDDELDGFTDFLVKFLDTLKWQIPKGVQMHTAYHHLLNFQTYVNQAAGERYAIQRRHDYLISAFDFYKNDGGIEGDTQYLEATGNSADDERAKLKKE